MSFYAQTGMVIAYILLFAGSVLLGYYLIVALKNFLRRRGRQGSNG